MIIFSGLMNLKVENSLRWRVTVCFFTFVVRSFVPMHRQNKNLNRQKHFPRFLYFQKSGTLKLAIICAMESWKFFSLSSLLLQRNKRQNLNQQKRIKSENGIFLKLTKLCTMESHGVLGLLRGFWRPRNQIRKNDPSQLK